MAHNFADFHEIRVKIKFAAIVKKGIKNFFYIAGSY